ncbi:hypothetical protein GCM10027085_55120 [Spirosoma aerophilum]
MDSVDLSALVQPVPAANRFVLPDYNIWCGSMIPGNHGKYYLFYARWPRVNGHLAWITHSEIALARADKPEGPYQHVKVILPARGASFWDGVCTHNPAVIAHKGKFYLYYMGTTGKAAVKQPASANDPGWWEYRNNQRIGVAVADNPEGEWKRFDKPVLDVSPDSTAFDALMVSNPSATVDNAGRVILVYKQVEKNNTLQGGKVRFGVAFANALTGPFVKHPTPIFEAKDRGSEWMVAEDPYLWHYKGKNYAIVRDVVGKFTGEKDGLALLRSTNGYDWRPAPYPKVLGKTVYQATGEPFDDKLERPCLYTEKGVPKLLFGAMGVRNRAHSMNVFVPLSNSK